MPNKNSSKKSSVKRLCRSNEDVVLAGVAAGLAEFFEIDSILVRIIFVLLTIFGGSGILIYLVLWLLIPKSADAKKSTEEIFKKNMAEVKGKAKQAAAEFKDLVEEDDHHKKRKANKKLPWFGIIILTFGTILILTNYGFVSLRDIFPAFLVILGLMLIFR